MRRVLAAVFAVLTWACGAADSTFAQSRRADLAALRDEYVQKSSAFAPSARDAALLHLASLEARATELSDADFLIGVARTAALADNGHDSWHPGDGAWLPAHRAPLRFEWFPDALVVARATEPFRDLAGAKVMTIDGRDAFELYERLRLLSGGIESYRRWNLSVFLERAEAPPGAEPGLTLAGLTPPGGVDAPLYLREPDRRFRFVERPEIGAACLQFRSHYGTGAEPIEEFLRTAHEKLAEAKPDHLIVAAAVVAQAAGDRVFIVGEPVGDRLRFWSEGAPLCLRASKYCVQATDGLWDLINGCAQEPGCYGDRFGVRVPDLDPDLAAPFSAAAWLAGDDPEMTAIESHLLSCRSCRADPDDGG